jgi:DNA-binding transcriptional regulator PaaX
LLGADWLQLLRADPGLPAHHLSADWPADRSAETYRRCYQDLLPAARRELSEEFLSVAN